MNQNLWRKHAMRYFQITLGCLLVCLGFNLFLIPAHLLTGGISGVALIIYYLTDLPVGMQNLVYNLPILYLAYRVFGRLYAADTIFGTEFPVVASLAERLREELRGEGHVEVIADRESKDFFSLA